MLLYYVSYELGNSIVGFENFHLRLIYDMAILLT